MAVYLFYVDIIQFEHLQEFFQKDESVFDFFFLRQGKPTL